MSNISTLKKSSVLDLNHLAKVIEKQNNPQKNNREPDPRFWKPERDKAGNAYAVIRFLPPAIVNGESEELLWVQMFSHGFKNPQTGKWYIEKSRTTLEGERDLLSQYNSFLWNSNPDDKSPERAQARAQKRRVHWISNILVVKDPKNPQNEGKVFLYQYGKKVYDKIQSVMFPTIPDIKGIHPFDPDVGYNFNLIIQQVAGYPNYDQSRFVDTPSAIDNKDEVVSKAYSLKDLISEDKFESNEELTKRLNRTMGFDVEAFLAANAPGSAPSRVPSLTPVAPAPVVSKPQTVEDTMQESPPWDSDDEVSLDEFKSLMD